MSLHAEISAQAVVRDRWGSWTHPDFFIGDNLLPGEFDAWLIDHNLTSATTWMTSDVPECQMEKFWKSGNCSDWEPSGPGGEGWFIGSIHDTEDGPVCIWLRLKQEEQSE